MIFLDLFKSFSRPLILCEYQHAMGNSNGDMDKYWEAFYTYSSLQGGFIWDFADQVIFYKVPSFNICFRDYYNQKFLIIKIKYIIGHMEEILLMILLIKILIIMVYFILIDV
jgi:hypothetical protein